MGEGLARVLVAAAVAGFVIDGGVITVGGGFQIHVLCLFNPVVLQRIYRDLLYLCFERRVLELRGVGVPTGFAARGVDGLYALDRDFIFLLMRAVVAGTQARRDTGVNIRRRKILNPSVGRLVEQVPFRVDGFKGVFIRICYAFIVNLRDEGYRAALADVSFCQTLELLFRHRNGNAVAALRAFELQSNHRIVLICSVRDNSVADVGVVPRPFLDLPFVVSAERGDVPIFILRFKARFCKDRGVGVLTGLRAGRSDRFFTGRV